MNATVGRVLLRDRRKGVEMFPTVPSGFTSTFALHTRKTFVISSIVSDLKGVPFIRVGDLTKGRYHVRGP